MRRAKYFYQFMLIFTDIVQSILTEVLILNGENNYKNQVNWRKLKKKSLNDLKLICLKIYYGDIMFIIMRIIFILQLFEINLVFKYLNFFKNLQKEKLKMRI